MDLISIDAPAARVAAAGEALEFLDASLGIVASSCHGRLEVPAWDRHGLFDAELRGQLFEFGPLVPKRKGNSDGYRAQWTQTLVDTAESLIAVGAV